jgi:hypothetical protein
MKNYVNSKQPLKVLLTGLTLGIIAFLAVLLFSPSVLANPPAKLKLVDDSIYINVAAIYTAQPASVSDSAKFVGRFADLPFADPPQNNERRLQLLAVARVPECDRPGFPESRYAESTLIAGGNATDAFFFLVAHVGSEGSGNCSPNDFGTSQLTARIEVVFEVDGSGATFSSDGPRPNTPSALQTMALYDHTRSEYVAWSDMTGTLPIALEDGHRYTLWVTQYWEVRVGDPSDMGVGATFQNARFQVR